jgi:CRP-like cAMP-binding protein
MNKENQNVIVGEAKTGELIGEMSFLDNLPRSASVKASVDSEVLVIPKKKFVATMDNQPRWFKSLIQTLSSRLREADARIANKFVQTDED